MHRAVGISGDGHVHDASWDVESLYLTLQAILDRPSFVPSHSGAASVGHALRRAIIERRRPQQVGATAPLAIDLGVETPTALSARSTEKHEGRTAPGIAAPSVVMASVSAPVQTTLARL